LLSAFLRAKGLSPRKYQAVECLRDDPQSVRSRPDFLEANICGAQLRAASAPGQTVVSSNLILREADVCAANAGMYQRIGENIHKRPGVPACPKK
jgi:hypothetical protein